MRALLAGSAGLVVYVLAGYPLLASLLAQLRPRPLRTVGDHLPRVSLIIAAYNEQDAIDAKLANAAVLEYPSDRLEVIVVSDGSDDDTAARAARHSGVRVLHHSERQGKAAALNRGAAAASGEILVFTDANNLLARDSVHALVRPFADPSVGCVSGRKTIDDGSGRSLDAAEGLYWRYEAAILRGEASFGSVSGVTGDLLALRRAAFERLAAGTINDDQAVALQAVAAGWRIAYAPEALSLERASATTAGESERRARIAGGRGQALWRLGPRVARRDPLYAWQLVSHKVLRLAIAPALATALLANLALVRRSRLEGALATGQLAFYALALVGWRADRRGRRSRWLFLPYYFCRMYGAGIRGLARALVRPTEELTRWQRVTRG
jgi:cellulose synthase/poly-beta-1,6-N-acetylglucosamine synthase-like glycosyltransferase